MNIDQQKTYNDLSLPLYNSREYIPMSRERFVKLMEFQSEIQELNILLDVKPKYKEGDPYKKVKRSSTK